MGRIIGSCIKFKCGIVLFLFKLPGLRMLCSDRYFVKNQYRYHIGRKPNLDDPQTFTEKLQWIKLNIHDPLFTKMVDKYEVRSIVSEIIGNEYLAPLIVEKRMKSIDEIDFDKLPNAFVIKTAHDSSSAIIVRDKNKANINEIKNKLKKHLKTNYYWAAREWPYKNVEPSFIIEKYLRDNDSDQLREYEIYCFNGVPKFIQAISHENNDTIINTYSTKWEYIDVSFGHHTNPNVMTKCPENLDKMLDLARVLSKDFAFLRVDLHDTGSEIYFGELTFFDCAGYVKIQSEAIDKKIGDMINLSLYSKNKKIE